jgi:metal-responsive CopG/Arc/MetJ family transcriptional regulator
MVSQFQNQKINEPKKRFNVMFPESLLKNVDEYRGKHGLKRSELLAAAAEQYMSSPH